MLEIQSVNKRQLSTPDLLRSQNLHAKSQETRTKTPKTRTENHKIWMLAVQCSYTVEPILYIATGVNLKKVIDMNRLQMIAPYNNNKIKISLEGDE